MEPTQRDAVGKKVRTFYEDCSFPGYDDFDSPLDLIEKARRGMYARVLDEQLPLGVRILDAGCGTGQLAIFLSMVHRNVVGADFSRASLAKANAFKRRFDLKRVSFVQMDLFQPALRPESFDYVFSNGVLHHTADAYGAFQNLCTLVKPGGYITLGLYNSYGRLFLDARRWIFRVTRDHLQRLDYFMRQKSTGAEKKRIWYMDQYKNPHEDKFSVDDILGWFEKNAIEYVNAVPKIRLGRRFTSADSLFEPQAAGSRVEHLLCQFRWIFTEGREGGFFILLGRKKPLDGARFRGDSNPSNLRLRQ
jgi:SAM-dependent methyltransferase